MPSDTILLIHGLWMTPRCWEDWKYRFEQRGLRVLAPSYPGMEGEVEALREDPSSIGGLSIEQVVDHYETIIRLLAKPPILVGHSFGGAFVQLLLDRGLGAAGVAIHSAPVKGVLRLPFTSILSNLPVLTNPANRSRAVALSPSQFRYAFTNTLSKDHARAVYERYHVPAPGRFVFDAAFINFSARTAMKVDFHKPDRAPLLLVGGSADHIVPASVNRANASLYRSGRVDFKEYEGRSHYTLGEPGWEQVADDVLAWAESVTAEPADALPMPVMTMPAPSAVETAA